MPNSLVKKFAEQSKRSVATVEKAWDDIVDGISKNMDSDDPKFYPTVVSTLKKKLGIKDESKKQTTETKKATTMYSGPSSVKEDFTNSLATSNIDLNNNKEGNGAFFPKMGSVQKKKKKTKKKKVNESVFVVRSSVGSLKENDQTNKPLSELDLWMKKYGNL